MSDGRVPDDVDDDLDGLATERTTLAWTRTGLSFAVAGAFLLRVLGDGRAPVQGIPVALVALGSLAWSWGWRSAERRPAVGTRLGRATVRTMGLGTAAVGVVAVVLQLLP